jgi:hypothetical protein
MKSFHTWDRYDRYRAVVVGASALWHVYFRFPASRTGSSLFLFLLGMSPYFALAAMARWAQRMPLLLTAGVVLGGQTSLLESLLARLDRRRIQWRSLYSHSSACLLWCRSPALVAWVLFRKSRRHQ